MYKFVSAVKKGQLPPPPPKVRQDGLRISDVLSDNDDDEIIAEPDPTREGEKGKKANIFDENGEPLPADSKKPSYDKNGKLLPINQLYDKHGEPVRASSTKPKFDAFGNPVREVRRCEAVDLEARKRRPKKGSRARIYDKKGRPMSPGAIGKRFDKQGRELTKD